MPKTTHENPNLPSARPLGSEECRYILGSDGQCPKTATHIVSLKGRYKMPVCEEHADLYRRPGHKHTYTVEPLPNAEVSSGAKNP